MLETALMEARAASHDELVKESRRGGAVGKVVSDLFGSMKPNGWKRMTAPQKAAYGVGFGGAGLAAMQFLKPGPQRQAQPQASHQTYYQ